MSFQSALLRTALGKTLRGGGSTWVALSVLGLAHEATKRAKQSKQEVYAVEKITPGHGVSISVLPPEPRKK